MSSLFSPYFPRSPIRTRYISRCPLSIRLSLPLVHRRPAPRSLPRGTIARLCLVNLSSFSVPRTFEHQRVHRRYHNRRSPGDVTGVGAPPCKRKRERKKEMETERERETLSHLSFQACPLFSHLLLSSFIPANSTPSVSVVRVYLLYLSPFLLLHARAGRHLIDRRHNAKSHGKIVPKKKNETIKFHVYQFKRQIHGWTGTEG